MSVDRDGQLLAFNADVFDNQNELVARIESNEFHLIPGKYAYQKRSSDRSALTVFDRQGKRLLLVHYLNRESVKITGSFSCSDGIKLFITENSMTFDTPAIKNVNIGSTCAGDTRGITIWPKGFTF